MFSAVRLTIDWTARQAGAVAFGIMSLFLTSCALIPTSLPTEKAVVIDEIEPGSSTGGPTVYAIESGDQIISYDDPDDLIAQANSAPTTEIPGLLIRAVNAYLDQNQIQAAKSLISRLESFPLSADERFSIRVIRARIANKTEQHVRALEMLSGINFNQVRDQNIGRHLYIVEVAVDSQMALGRKTDAVISLLALDPLIAGPNQLRNQRNILNLLESLEPAQLSKLRTRTRDLALDGWLALTDVFTTSSTIKLQTNLENWRNNFIDHPAQPELLTQYSALAQTDEFQQIALLLPLTSSYGSAARAFHDGFMAAYNLETSFRKPQVLLYDIGEEPSLSTLYYQAAKNEGADFIVGPLGRMAAQSLIENQQPEISTLLIAEIPDGGYSENLYGISLSPENEARQTAKHAFIDGHRYATVFGVEGQWGQRVADAFVSQWQALGGVVVKKSTFPKGISDYTRIIQKYLGLNRSMARHKLLQTRAGTRLEFMPRRNDDMDFIFLAANSAQARLIVPQLRFFQAHDLPIYATSYVYSGRPNPGVDEDLDGLIFGEMEWLVDGVQLYRNPNGKQNFGDINKVNVSRSPYLHSDMDRLYALGVQSYQMIPKLGGLRSNTWGKYEGDAMTVSVDSNGNVVRHPVWVRFKSGLVESLRDTL